MRDDLEELARKHEDCRVFLEYVDDNYEDFHVWLDLKMKELMKKGG